MRTRGATADVVRAMAIAIATSGCVPIGEEAFGRRLGICTEVHHELGPGVQMRAAADVDGDGLQDLIVSAMPPALHLMAWDGNGFSVASTIGTSNEWDWAPTIVHAGGAGKLDVLVAVAPDLFRCVGSQGEFERCDTLPTTFDLSDLLWAPRGHWTGNELPDLFEVTTARVFSHRGGRYDPLGEPLLALNYVDSWASSDLDGDGLEDLVLHYEDEWGGFVWHVFRGDADVGLVEAASFPAEPQMKVVMADLAGTGEKRVHVVVNGDAPFQVYRLEDALTEPRLVAVDLHDRVDDRPTQGGPMVVADVNEDGVDDLVVEESPFRVFFGQGGGIGVDTVGQRDFLLYLGEGDRIAADVTGDGLVDFTGATQLSGNLIGSCE